MRAGHVSTTAALALWAGAATATPYDCVIEPALVVEIASASGGLIREIGVSRGDLVTRGQIVAQLNAGIEETTVDLVREEAISTAEIEAQAARLKLAESRAERTGSLVERNIAPQADLDEAEASVEVSRRELLMSQMRQRVAAMELKRAEEVLRQRSIVSPIDGVVLERLLYIGEFADQDRPVVRIAQLDPLHIEAFLPVTAYPDLTVGMQARISPGPPIGGSYLAEVTVIDKVFDAASNTFGIRAKLPNPDLAIPAGSRCEIELLLEGEE
ncbi:MAG: efflux RND transporter periplasmic adaptor subunit [Pseudomonadota bacterium]